MSYFSIIVPVYNMAGRMDACFRSLASQTFADFEVLFVDDGSTDDSLRDIREYCRQDSRFRFITYPKNRSILIARYTGMRQVNGSYILFVDSDDTLSSRALELLYQRLRSTPVDILRFGHEEVYHDNTVSGKTIPEKNRTIMPLHTDNPLLSMLSDQMAPNIFKNCYARGVVERAILRAEQFYCNMGEDVYWSTVLFSCAQSDGILEECLYHYNIGGGISTASTNRTLQQLTSYMGHLRVCMDHVRTYLATYHPELLPLTDGKFLRMNCFLMLSFVIDETDYSKVIDYLKAFDTEELRTVYLHGCNKVLPFKFRRQNRITDEMLDRLGFSHDRLTVNYLEDLRL